MPAGFTTEGFAQAVDGRAPASDYYDNENAWNNWHESAIIGQAETIPGLGQVVLFEIEGENDKLGRVAMLFKVTDEDGVIRYFRKESSWDHEWGTRTWDGPLTEIVPVPTTVLSWIDR